MSEEFKKIESILEQAKEYANIRVAQLKLSMAEKLSKAISVIIAALVAGLVFLGFLLFGSISAAIAIGQWLGKLWLGFLLVAVFYLLAGIIIWIAKDRLLRIPIMNSLIEKLFTNDYDEKD
jgi:Zn-dependent protease with chaperone function